MVNKVMKKGYMIVKAKIGELHLNIDLVCNILCIVWNYTYYLYDQS